MDLRIILIFIFICAAHSSRPKITVSVDEEVPIGTWITTLSNNPLVTGNMRQEDLPLLTYKLMKVEQKHSADLSDYIDIDKLNGSVTIKNRLDREAICPDNPEICMMSCSVMIVPVIFRLIILEIVIKDVNDQHPNFPVPAISLNVSEHVPVNTKFQLPLATDKDTEAFGIKSYSISPIPGLEGSDYVAKKFALARGLKNLELVVQESPNLNEDRALNPDQSYSFNVVATDKGNPPLEGQMEVRIHILGENNNSPVFGKSFYEGSLSEDAEVGATVLTVTATDFDKGANGRVFYSLPGDETNFAIDKNTGIISLKSKLDREIKSRYEFSVEARDGGMPSRTATATVSVEVRDVNDNKPTISFMYLNEDGLWENSRPPVAVIWVNVEDDDGDLNGYVKCRLEEGSDFFGLSGEPNSLEKSKTFSFNNRQQFFISSTSTLDSETTRTIDVTLVCHDSPMDGKNLVSSVTIPVRILDINDNDPVFSNVTYNMSILENAAAGTSIGTVSASDLDEGPNGRLTYKLSNDSSDFFAIDPSSGEIKSREPLDREVTASYELTVMASDAGSPSRSGTTTVHVKVLDVNDNLPKFDQPDYVFPIPSFSRGNTPVGTIRATDADEGDNAIVEFRIVNDPAKCSEIYIEGHSGRLYTNREADPKRCKVHDFHVEAKNPNSDKSSSVPVTVYVSEPLDVKPIFAFPKDHDNDSVVLRYPVYEGQEVTRLSVASGTPTVTYALLATRYKSGKNLETSASWRPECLSKVFNLDSKSGSITLDLRCLGGLDNLLRNSTFELTVKASNAKMPFLRSEATLKVSFDDLSASSFDLASLGSNPNFVIILAIVASTVLLAVALSSVIVCLVFRSRRQKGINYKMCCKTGPPAGATVITMEGKQGGGAKDQVANGLLEAKFQQGNSSSASTLYDRDSQSSDSGRGPSESDFQPVGNVASRRTNVPLVGLASVGPTVAMSTLRSSQEPLGDPAVYSGNQYPVHQQGKSPVHKKSAQIYQQPRGRYVEGASEDLRFKDGRYPLSPSDTYGVSQDRSRTSSIQSLRPSMVASLEDFDQLDAQGFRNSKRVLGRRDQKRSSMILSPKNRQGSEEGGEGKTRVPSHDGLDADQFSPSYASPFYYPNRAGLKNSLPKNGTGSQGLRSPPPYSNVSAGRPSKHVTFDDTLDHSSRDVGRRDYLPPVGSVANSSSGSYNVRRAENSHNSPVSFVVV